MSKHSTPPTVFSSLQHTRLNPLWQTLKNIHGKAGQHWLETLPQQLQTLLEQRHWQLLPMHYKLSYHLVLGTSAGVLKLSPPCEAFTREIEALRAYQGIPGVVKLLDCDPNFGYLLLETLTDQTLGHRYQDLAQDRQLTEQMVKIIQNLHGHSQQNTPHPRAKFPRLADYWDGFTRYHGRYQGKTPPFDPAQVRQAEDCFRALCRTSPEPVLLHGDLHGYNILIHQQQPVIIDPKGVWGDPAFEPTAFLFNHLPTDRDAQEACLKQRLAIFETAFGERVLPWAFAQSVLSALWHDEDGENGHEAMALVTLFQRWR